MSQLTKATLQDTAAWEALRESLDAHGTNVATFRMIDHLKRLGVKSCIIEESYLDQDFTEAFAKFYASLFKRHHKDCRRFHFFTTDVTPLFSAPTASELFLGLTDKKVQESYVGFAVVRPIKHAPLGRVVLSVPPPIDQRFSQELMVKSEYEIHLCGAPLRVSGVAFTQQDSRVGSCAQATIWMAGRHFHIRHRGPWFSTNAITEAATTLADIHMSTMLPAGSESLHLNHMLQALRAVDRQALLYAASGRDKNTQQFIWSLRPRDVIHRYVDSGIPIILGLCPLLGEPVGHATLATGVVYEKDWSASLTNPRPTKAEIARFFLSNDDQRGPNILLPISSSTPSAETPHSIEANLYYLIVALPKKVYVTAEQAEELAWDLAHNYATNLWPASIKDSLKGTNTQTAEKFIAHLGKNDVVARTYLTYGWKCKARMLANEIHSDCKDQIIYLDLPKFVWVTEFGCLADISSSDRKRQVILAHAVIDATASRYWEARLLFHAPGILVRWLHDSQDVYGDYKKEEIVIVDDVPYRPKLRGHIDIKPFA